MIAAMLRAPAAASLFFVFFVSTSRLASAQTSFEISAGYSLAHDPRDHVTLPAGWIAGAAVALTPVFSVAADVSGQYKTIPLFDADAKLRSVSALGGVRASGRIGLLGEFAQILFGAVRSTGSAYGSTTTGTSLSVQPGVGIDLPLARSWAARAQFDLRLIRSQPDATNGGTQFRFAAALVYRKPNL
jgi:hypothetical protein